MRYLIDTHIFIWWLKFSEKLQVNEREAIENPKHGVYISAATSWEIVIKRSLGKLEFEGSISQAIQENDFVELPITTEHAEELSALPSIHSDPFDRLLVGQAKYEKLILITRDPMIHKYDVLTLQDPSR